MCRAFFHLSNELFQTDNLMIAIPISITILIHSIRSMMCWIANFSSSIKNSNDFSFRSMNITFDSETQISAKTFRSTKATIQSEIMSKVTDWNSQLLYITKNEDKLTWHLKNWVRGIAKTIVQSKWKRMKRKQMRDDNNEMSWQ